jgi:hypothetical protein
LQLEDRVVIDKKAKKSFDWSTLDGFEDATGLHASELDQRKEYQWDGLSAATNLTDEQAWLCPPVIGCHGITTKEFYLVSVQKLEPVKWNVDAMQYLVLDDKKKKLLHSLVTQHYNPERRNHGGDIISGKGEGLVILLDGPPGVRSPFFAPQVSV